MEDSRTRTIARAALAAAALTAVVVGVPVLLLTWAGWPLPIASPDWNHVRDVLAGRAALEDVVVIKALACVVWVLWARITAAVVVEVAATVRDRGMPDLSYRPGMVRPAVAHLVACIVCVVSMWGPRTAPSTALPARPAVVLEYKTPASSPPSSAPSAPAAAAPAAATITVGDGDTLWGISARVSGDGRLWKDWANANGLPPPYLIHRGQQLVIPEGTPTPAPHTHIVQRGETLSGIARDELGDAARYPEIAAANQVADPNRIFAGQSFVIPDETTPAETSPPVPPPPPEPTAPTSTAPAPTTTPPPTEPAAPVTVDQATPSSAPSPSAPADHSHDDDFIPGVASVLGVTGAIVLASGLVVAARAALGRRRARSSERPVVSEPAREVWAAALEAADVPLVRWAAHELALLARQLDPTQVRAAPNAVQLSSERGLEILWDRPFHGAPRPWETFDGGYTWRTLFDPTAPEAPGGAASPIPALVSIGERNGQQLLLDLEAWGTLAVVGSAEAVESFGRSVILELAHGDDLSLASVGVVDIELGSNTGPRRAAVVDSTAALGLARSTVMEFDLAVDEENGPYSSFGLRIGPTVDVDAVHVVLVHGDHPAAEALVGEIPPRRGIGLVVLGDAPEANAVLRIEPDGRGRLEPLGIDLDLVRQVPATTAARVHEWLDQLGVSDEVAPEPEIAILGRAASDDQADPVVQAGLHPIEEIIDLTSAYPDAPASPPNGSAGQLPLDQDADLDDQDDDGWRPPSPDLLIRVLGEPVVGDGSLSLDRQQEPLAVFLATRGGRASRDKIANAVWGGRAVPAKTVANNVAGLRTKLGARPDGTLFVPAITRGQDVTLAGAMTDVEVVRILWERALQVSSSQAIPLLREALSHVRGVPYSGADYEWAVAEFDAHDAECLVHDVAVALAELAAGHGDVALAQEALRQGLRARPGDEVLYRARMRLEAAAGDVSAVRASYVELCTVLDQAEGEPSPETTELYGELVRAQR